MISMDDSLPANVIRRKNALKYMKEIKKFAEMRAMSYLDKEKCSLCLVNKPDTCIYPCGHGGICFECAKKLDVCHLCRDEMTMLLKLAKVVEKGKVSYKVVAKVLIQREGSSDEEENQNRQGRNSSRSGSGNEEEDSDQSFKELPSVNDLEEMEFKLNLNRVEKF